MREAYIRNFASNTCRTCVSTSVGNFSYYYYFTRSYI
jgi:hypothetical protein